MLAARRVYVYAVCLVSLVLLAWGLSGLAQALIEEGVTARQTILSNARDRVALNGAFATLGLLGWLAHWTLAQRAARDPAERAAALRRLFIYAALAVLVLVAANALQALIEAAATLMLAAFSGPGVTPAHWNRLLAPIPRLVVWGGFWWYYLAVAARDRVQAGESGASATLRRWYVYGIAFVALMLLLTHLRAVVRLSWESVALTTSGGLVLGDRAVLSPAATSLVGLLLWLSHWRRRPGPAERSGALLPAAWQAADAPSVLRPVYLFLGLAVAVATVLYGAWEVLFYAAGRLLGVAKPGGVTSPLPVALAGPGSLLLVYGVAWLYQRAALQDQARASAERPRQAGVRRLYVYLVSLVALATAAAGAGGLLWTLADLLTNAQHQVNPQDWWREQGALYASMLVVALPVWLLHWGRVASPADRAERGSLARRVYVYVALLGAVLALLGAGVTAVYQLYQLALGVSATAPVVSNLARALAVAAVAGLLAAYHLRTLRADQQRTPSVSSPPSSVPAVPPSADGAAGPTAERRYGVLIQGDGHERSEWFPTPDAARARADSISAAAANGSTRAIVVVADAAYFTA